VGLVAAVFTLAAAFLFVFPAAGLVAAADFALGLVLLVQAVSFYLVRFVGVLSVIGQNKLSCDWAE